MPIKVRILETGTTVEVNQKRVKVRELLEYLGLSISENLVLRKGAILIEDDYVVEGDEVVVFTVKSGG